MSRGEGPAGVTSRPSPPWWCRQGGPLPPHQPCRAKAEGLGPEDICLEPPSVAGHGRQPRSSGWRRWAPASEGGRWPLGPSRPGTETGCQGCGAGGRSGGRTPPEPGLGRSVLSWVGTASYRLAREGVWQEVRQQRHGTHNRWDAEGGARLRRGDRHSAKLHLGVSDPREGRRPERREGRWGLLPGAASPTPGVAAAGIGPQFPIHRMRVTDEMGHKDSGRDDVAGVTLPPAGSGRTFLCGCF